MSVGIMVDVGVYGTDVGVTVLAASVGSLVDVGVNGKEVDVTVPRAMRVGSPVEVGACVAVSDGEDV